MNGQGMGRTFPVAKNPANPFGLYGMLDNITEMCQDVWVADGYKAEAVQDPQGPARGLGRVSRGGG